MNITILAVGSRGDVQPYVALAQGLQAAGHGLQAAGHAVKVAAGTNFECFVRGQGVDYAPLRADYYALMDSRFAGGSGAQVWQSDARDAAYENDSFPVDAPLAG